MDDEAVPPLLRLSDPGALPSFDVARRGYDRGQVDEYLDRLEQSLAVAHSHRDAAQADRNTAVQRVAALEQQLSEARRKLTEGERPTYASLGARVEQMLRLAEEEAEQIRHAAVAHTNGARAQAETLFEQAQLRAAQAERDFEEALAERRRQAEEEGAEHRVQVEKRLQAAEARIAAAESVAQQRISGAQAEAERLVGEATARAERLRHDAEQHAAALVQAARHDGERLLVEARGEAEGIVTEARAQAERRRRENDVEIADLLRRRDSINEQLAALREVLGALPVRPLAEPTDNHPTVPTGSPDEVNPSLVDVTSAGDRMNEPGR
ncbi:MAG: DivIVA domain-containing protein [Actinomycetota bacterium]|nr:DivIVA domain-containing protein [Actinomycetota bacterium]